MKRAVLDVAELIGSYGRFVSYPQAAEITSLSVRSLKRETAAGNLPCYRLGSARVYRLKVEDVACVVLHDAHHTRAAIRCLDGRENRIRRGRGKHRSGHSSIEHAVPNESRVEWLVP